jgi:HD-GYP domain-containing protein (c-di-GMP phosphodiesterase class II)
MRISDVSFIIDNMSEDMLDHAEHVAMLCYAMGQEINANSKELEILWMSGMLHEAGKIDFNKSIHIGDEDVDIDKSYMILSDVLLKHVKGFDALSTTIIQHQENYDGSGFPNRLKAEQIDTLAKVLRIADFYDTARRNGNDHDQACVLIREKSDKFFPRKIITPFIKSIIMNELQFEY